MKITIYELLGIIKDGKAPKKIKYKNKIYYYHKGYDFDYAYTTDESGFLRENKSLFQFSSYKNNCWNDNSMIDFLNDEVEILEEEKKIPEKLGEIAKTDEEYAYCWTGTEAKLKDKINEIIDYLKSKGE